MNIITKECEGLRRHSSIIFLILLFTKPNIEVSGWLYQTKTHFTHIIYQPFSRVLPPSFTLYGYHHCITKAHNNHNKFSCIFMNHLHKFSHKFSCINQTYEDNEWPKIHSFIFSCLKNLFLSSFFLCLMSSYGQSSGFWSFSLCWLP